MKEIELTRGYCAKVDDENYEELVKFKWYALGCRPGSIYAVRKIRLASGRQTNEFMHRRILSASEDIVVDHVNGDGLDNRRSNLRLCSLAENNRNRRRGKDNTSGYKGVHWCRRRRLWRARIKHGRRPVCLGFYKTPEEAARAYDGAAKTYHGEFALLNFPAEPLLFLKFR